MSGLWKKYTPSVSRMWLSLVAGLIWSITGATLCALAGSWLWNMDWPWSLAGALAGFTMGLIAYRFGFSRIVLKTLSRIEKQPERVCIFAFQAWSSYLLVAIMVLVGYVVRHSSLPHLAVAILYWAIGTALMFSSSLYYHHIY